VIRPPLIAIWQATNLLCGKRLAACLPVWVPFYRDVQGRCLPAEVQEQLCSLSHATIDRLLAPSRARSNKIGLATTRPGTLLRARIPVKTNQWDESRPGFLEADTVAHCGTSMSGSFVYTVAVTDIATGWSEHRAMWGRGEYGAVAQLQDIEAVLPFHILGFDCDNGSEFLNHHLVKYFLHRKQPVAFTRSRAYHANDNAHIEQKNWTQVRQYLGYARFDNPDVVPIMNDLYRNEWHVLHNFFLPSVKLIAKHRDGSRIVKVHDEPKTPWQRLIESPAISRIAIKRLSAESASLDPFALQRSIARKIKQILRLAHGG
jgi:hypothetical protein